MADNFDMKKFLVENKLGAYSRLRTEGKAAYEYEKGKAAGEKLAKEDMGKDLEDTKAAGMMDFLAEEDPLNEDASQVVMDLLGQLAGVAGIALTGVQILRWQDKLEKENPELHKQLGKVSGAIGAADPSKNLEEKNEESLNEDASQTVIELLGMLAGLAGMGLSGVQILKWQDKLEKENPELHKQLGKVSSTIGGADPSKNLEEKKEEIKEAMRLKPKEYYQILDNGTDEWNDDFRYIGEIDGGSSVGEIGDHMFMAPTGPGAFVFVNISDADLDTMVKPSMSEGKEKEEKSLNEALSPEAFERMDALTSNTAQTAMIRAAEIMMNQLTKEGFEVLDIREYFTQLIANDI
jgi:hypothetical protein